MEWKNFNDKPPQNRPESKGQQQQQPTPAKSEPKADSDKMHL